MPQPAPDSIAFDDVVIDFAGRRLVRGGGEQALEPKAFAVLELLTGSPGRVFSRDEILDAVWGHRHVTQSVLNRIMSLLRQALGEDAQRPRRLHTVHGIGYRFDMPMPASHPEATATIPIPSSAATIPPSPPSRRWPWLAGVAATLLLVFAATWLRKGEDAPTATGPDKAAGARPALAVLPFVDLSQARDQEYLADGLAEEILNQLAQSPALRVVGRTSSFSFKGKNEDLRTIGQQLGAAHLLEGSVRKDGDRLRITAQLVRAADGIHLWSKTYAREERDVFAVQDEISRDVAQALSVKLDVARYNREQAGTTHVEAYERFLRWRSIVMQELYDFAHDRERLQLAREMVALDPQCTLCWDALASSLRSMAQEVGGAQAEQLRAEALQVRERIARMAPDSWVAKRDRSNALWLAGKRAEAIALAKEIVDSGPLTTERVWDYAYMIYAMGHLNETIALVEQVRAVEPMALFLSRDLQFDYTAARRYQDAEAEYQRGLKLEGIQLEPTYMAFFRQLAGKRPGGLQELRELHRQLLEQGKGFDTPFFRDLGQELDDRAAMLDLVRKALTDGAYGGDLAYVWTSVADALGDADLAVAALRKELEAQQGFQEGTLPQFPYVAFWNAPFSGVRAHSDYKRLLIEAGVADYWRQTGKWGDGCRPVGTDDFQCE
ncbi:winged helix-turn-helix domain-containing protein [Povalibacter sp.]|uniref:winged helix-turn-helix domain-containing protein n=1 Tax=Povalibacter sp. TaxID=1962978 RepID=UPI002F414D5A